MDENREDELQQNEPHANPDPLTGAPGSHPLGTGVGTAGGGLAGAAIGAVVGGPVGAMVGAVVGGVAGAFSGHSVAEAVNHTDEEAFWRAEHAGQEWGKDGPYEHYEPAYKTGIAAAEKYRARDFHEIEEDLARDYEKTANVAIPWDRARPAVRAAWDRLGGVTGPRDSDRGMRGGI